MLLVGRAHFYEGHTMDLVTFATRVCKVIGVETMIGASPPPCIIVWPLRCRQGVALAEINHVVTNAAGGLNPEYAVGDIVCLNDVSKPLFACNQHQG